MAAEEHTVDTSTEHREHMRRIVIPPEDAMTIKSQLFELCKQGDIDKNHEISFDEFASVIKKFLPNSTDKRLHEMFRSLDDNDDGALSYVEFLSDDNFNKFLEYCGYYSEAQDPESADIDADVGDILTRCVSIRNDHDKQIIMAQQEVISKLNAWIEDVGKAAVSHAEQLQMTNDALVQEHAVYDLETNTMQQELNRLVEENKNIKNECETAARHKNILTQKLKDLKETLQESENALEKYYNLERKWKEIETRNAQLIKENLRLKLKVDEELVIIDHLEAETSQLKETSVTRLHAMEEINEHDHILQDKVAELKDELRQANETIAKKDREMEELRESVATITTLSTDNEINEHMRKTVRFNTTLRMEESPAPPLNTMTSTRSSVDSDDEAITGWNSMFGFHGNDSVKSVTPGWPPEDGVTPKQRTIDMGVTPNAHSYINANNVYATKINEYERKEIEWIKVKEDMKMENERLKKQVIALKDVDKVNKRLGRELIDMQNKNRPENILDRNEDEETPFIEHRNAQQSKSFQESFNFNPFCSIFKC